MLAYSTASRAESIRQVVSWYKSSFQDIRAAPVPSDIQREAQFAQIVQSIYERHSATLITMAKGAHEIRSMLKHDVASFADYEDVQRRLDEFYMSRIGIRMVTTSPRIQSAMRPECCHLTSSHNGLRFFH